MQVKEIQLGSPTHQTPEMARLLLAVSGARGEGPDGKKSASQLRLLRRKIRYRLFRLREGQLGEFDQGLKKWIELQLKPMGDMSWHEFTFGWDVAAQDPLKVITPFEWDGSMLRDADGQPRCDPPAFTRQK